MKFCAGEKTNGPPAVSIFKSTQLQKPNRITISEKKSVPGTYNRIHWGAAGQRMSLALFVRTNILLSYVSHVNEITGAALQG